MHLIRPRSGAHHVKSSMFTLKDLHTCSHVLVRTDAVHQLLEPPYSGPYKVIEKKTERLYKLEMKNKEVNISVDRLKPVFLDKEETLNRTPPNNIPTNSQRIPKIANIPIDTQVNEKVTF